MQKGCQLWIFGIAKLWAPKKKCQALAAKNQSSSAPPFVFYFNYPSPLYSLCSTSKWFIQVRDVLFRDHTYFGHVVCLRVAFCILSITTLMYVAKISLVHACSIFIGNLSQGKGHRRSSAYNKNCKVIDFKYCIHW